MFGLFAFFYGTLHLTTYLWFDKFFVLALTFLPIFKAQIHHGGLSGLRILMIPLAVTQRENDPAAGQAAGRSIHRLIYVSATRE